MTEIFWLSVGAIVFIYAGYPAVLWAAGVLGPNPVIKRRILPSVSILISAYNEEATIRETIANKLALNYPQDRLEIIVTSDGSTDRTEDIVRSFAAQGVRLRIQSPRAGKTAALNQAARIASGDILVFADANSMYHPNALLNLVQNFADGTVGYVTGKMVYVDASGSVIGSGCSAYMRYENVLRSLESQIGSVVGVDGGIDAVRKSLYEPMSPEMLPDFVLPLRVVAAGYRVVYEPEALLMESTLNQSPDEWKMRTRVIVRSFHALWVMKDLFNVFRAGRYAFQLVSHKLLRYLAGVFQMLALGSNAMLVGTHWSYDVLLASQLGFYACAITGYFLSRNGRSFGPMSYSYYFCLLNGAALAGLWRFLKGERQVIWQPRKGG